MSSCIRDVALTMPSSSSGAVASRVLKSNHDGMRNPALRVTGIVDAVGQITLTCGPLISAIDLAQPWLKIIVVIVPIYFQKL